MSSLRQDRALLRGAVAATAALAVNAVLWWALAALNARVPREGAPPPAAAATLRFLPPPEPEPPAPAEPRTVALAAPQAEPAMPAAEVLSWTPLELAPALAFAADFALPPVAAPRPVALAPREALPAPERVQGPLDAEHVDQPPREVYHPSPRYPTLALRWGHEGFVTVRLLIDARGTVQEVSVRERRGPQSFEEAVTSVIRQWRFTPARHRGQDVAVWADKTIEFRLEEDR